jgi:hypothetical protein
MKVAEASWRSGATYLSRKAEIWSMLQTFGDPNRNDRATLRPAFEAEGRLSLGGDATFTATDLKPGVYVAFGAIPGNKDKLFMRVMANGTAMKSPLYIDAVPTAIFRSEGADPVRFALTGVPGASYWLQVHRLDGEEEAALSQ